MNPRRRLSLAVAVVAASLVAVPTAWGKGVMALKVGETGKSRGITGFRAAFSGRLDKQSAQKVRNYAFVGTRPDGTRARIALRSARYLPRRRAVRVRVAEPFEQTNFTKLRIQLKGRRGGLTDAKGRRLDGDRDGRPGGDAPFRFRVISGKTVTFTDRDGDQAKITIKRGGRLDGIAPIGGPAEQRTQFWILDPIALRSTLSGTVRPRGDGIVVIAEIIGLDKVNTSALLQNSQFKVNVLTQTSNATGRG
jgi:hypothetical protein